MKTYFGVSSPECSFFSPRGDCHSFNFNYKGGFSKEPLCSVTSPSLVVDLS